MLETTLSAGIWGVALGAVNGIAGRTLLARSVKAGNTVFYAVFVAGVLWRFAFLIAAVWFLRDKKYIILLSFAGFLILTQFILGVVPLRVNGIKNNT